MCNREAEALHVIKRYEALRVIKGYEALTMHEALCVERHKVLCVLGTVN